MFIDIFNQAEKFDFEIYETADGKVEVIINFPKEDCKVSVSFGGYDEALLWVYELGRVNGNIDIDIKK